MIIIKQFYYLIVQNLVFTKADLDKILKICQIQYYNVCLCILSSLSK